MQAGDNSRIGFLLGEAVHQAPNKCTAVCGRNTKNDDTINHVNQDFDNMRRHLPAAPIPMEYRSLHKCANYSGKARNMVDVAPARGETGGAVRDVGAAAEELGAPAEELGAAAEETRAAAEGAEDAEAVP